MRGFVGQAVAIGGPWKAGGGEGPSQKEADRPEKLAQMLSCGLGEAGRGVMW